MNRSTLLALIFLVAAPVSGVAHPGHGTRDPAAVSHYLLEPNHLLPLLVLCLAAGGIWMALRRRRGAKVAARRLDSGADPRR
jgi:hypothetical protein